MLVILCGPRGKALELGEGCDEVVRVISPLVDSRKLTASSNSTLTPLGSTFTLNDVVSAVGLGVTWTAALVGAGVR